MMTDNNSVKEHVPLEELTGLALGLRRILRLHRDLGLDCYPATDALRSFAAGRVATPRPGPVPGSRQGPPRPAQRSPRPAAPPARPVESLAMVAGDVQGCRRCPLAENRMGVQRMEAGTRGRLLVIGDWARQTGSFEPQVVFGRQEDEMLARMIGAIALTPQEVYVTNVVKCCPLPGQSAGVDHGRQCLPYLLREIQSLRPQVILAMGDMACQLLLDKKIPLVRLRGRWHQHRLSEGHLIKVMPTLHPRLLLEHPELKRAVWQDLQQVQKALAS